MKKYTKRELLYDEIGKAQSVRRRMRGDVLRGVTEQITQKSSLIPTITNADTKEQLELLLLGLWY